VARDTQSSDDACVYEVPRNSRGKRHINDLY